MLRSYLLLDKLRIVITWWEEMLKANLRRTTNTGCCKSLATKPHHKVMSR